MDPEPHPILVAHRGGNTLPALRAALAAGVDWVEIDVWFHYGRLVARHDRSIWRLPLTANSRSVRLNLTPAVVLSQVIERTRASGTRLLVDLKGRDPRLPAAIVETLVHGDALHRSALCGQDWGPLEAARAVHPATPLVFSLGRPEHLTAYLARRARGDAPDRVSAYHALLTEDRVDALKRAGATIIAWTVDDHDRARQLVAMGVDGVTSNNLAMLRALREAAR